MRDPALWAHRVMQRFGQLQREYEDRHRDSLHAEESAMRGVITRDELSAFRKREYDAFLPLHQFECDLRGLLQKFVPESELKKLL